MHPVACQDGHSAASEDPETRNCQSYREMFKSETRDKAMRIGADDVHLPEAISYQISASGPGLAMKGLACSLPFNREADS